MADAADGGNAPAPATPAPAPAPAAAPPAAAELVAKGKSEREVQLERENAKLRNTVQKQAGFKRKVETDNAHLADELQRLKQATQPQPQPATEKFTWMGFGSN